MPTDFQQLPQAEDVGAALGPVTKAETTQALADGGIDDALALKIVLQDTQLAENYLSSKGLPRDWDGYDDLYRAYVKGRVWPGTDVARANLGMPIVMETVEDVMPQIHGAFFSDPQPFQLEPVGKTTTAAARAASKVLCWAIKESGFKEEIRLHLKSCLLPGFAVSKWGYERKTVKSTTYARAEQAPTVPTGAGAVSIPTEASDEVTKRTIETEIIVPTFENLRLQNVLLDPALMRQDCRKGKYIVYQYFIQAEDLDDLRDQEGYKNIPSRAEMADIFSQAQTDCKNLLLPIRVKSYRENQAEDQEKQTSIYPSKRTLEILEYVCDDRVVTVLEGCIVIRNEENEFGCINALSNAFIDVLGSAYGFGIGFLLRGEQLFQQGVVNSWIDGLALQLNPMFQRIQGVNGGTQQIMASPGKVLNEAGKLEPLNQQSVTVEALKAIESSEARASRRIGLDASDIPTQAFRTGSGVQQLTASVAGKLQYFVDIFSDLVYIPALEAMLQICKNYMKPSQIQAILTEAETKDFQYTGDVMDIYNGQYRFEVLSSTKLAARKAAAQLIPMFVQLFSAAPVQDSLTQQNKKVNYTELVQEALDLGGWKTDAIIVEMTPEDQERAKQMQMGPALMQQAQQQQNQNNDLEKIQAKGEATAGNTIVRAIVKGAENEHALEKNIGPLLGGQ